MTWTIKHKHTGRTILSGKGNLRDANLNQDKKQKAGKEKTYAETED